MPDPDGTLVNPCGDRRIPASRPLSRKGKAMPKLVAAALAAATLLASPAAHAAEGRLPAFLANTSAQTITLDEANAVRGEGSRVTSAVARGARAFAASPLSSANPATRAAGSAIRSADRLGWEAGRFLSMRQHGSSADPGRYPGIRR